MARGPRATTKANPAQVTSRELDVLRLVGEGLYVSRRAVDHHVSAILRNLGVSTRGEAAQSATRLGLLQDADMPG